MVAYCAFRDESRAVGTVIVLGGVHDIYSLGKIAEMYRLFLRRRCMEGEDRSISSRVVELHAELLD